MSHSKTNHTVQIRGGGETVCNELQVEAALTEEVVIPTRGFDSRSYKTAARERPDLAVVGTAQDHEAGRARGKLGQIQHRKRRRLPTVERQTRLPQ